MTAICVDDEKLLADHVTKLCGELPGIDEALSFSSPFAALEWLETHTAGLALLDIDMPGMNGMELAARIKQRPCASAATSSSPWTPSASRRRWTTPSRADTPSSAHTSRRAPSGASSCLWTAGPWCSGRPNARSCWPIWSTAAAAASHGRRPLLFYGRTGSTTGSLRDSLREQGAESILEIKGGSLRICPEQITCDLFRFCRGEVSAFNEFRGEYMSGYAWASMTESYMAWKQTATKA